MAAARVRVKICGLTTPEDAARALAAGADYLGLVFAPGPRRIDLASAARIRSATGPEAARVGVFVDPDPLFVREAVAAGGLRYAQLHGSEGPELCAALGVPVIKTLRVGLDDVEQGLGRRDVELILLDTYRPGQAGGSGQPFAWGAARAWARRRRLFLAGGLEARNVGEAIATVAPFAVDVSSGVEAVPGRKDPRRLAAFMAAVRRATGAESAP